MVTFELDILFTDDIFTIVTLDFKSKGPCSQIDLPLDLICILSVLNVAFDQKMFVMIYIYLTQHLVNRQCRVQLNLSTPNSSRGGLLFAAKCNRIACLVAAVVAKHICVNVQSARKFHVVRCAQHAHYIFKLISSIQLFYYFYSAEIVNRLIFT